MTTIGLIRHGSTAWNKEGRAQGHTDNPLDAEGVQQAVLLAERLSTEQWDYLYSSDLLRARQTAEVIATRLGMEIAGLVPGIREMNAGQIEGTTEQDRVERWGSEWKKLDLGLESRRLVRSEAVRLSKISRRNIRAVVYWSLAMVRFYGVVLEDFFQN